MTASDEQLEFEGVKFATLPPKLFLYTLDQVCFIIQMPMPTLRRSHLFLQGRSTGVHHRHLLLARNIAEPTSRQADWRVAETELIRWMAVKGFVYRESGKIVR